MPQLHINPANSGSLDSASPEFQDWPLEAIGIRNVHSDWLLNLGLVFASHLPSKVHLTNVPICHTMSPSRYRMHTYFSCHKIVRKKIFFIRYFHNKKKIINDRKK